MNKKAEDNAPDPMAEKRAEYDHENKRYVEPKLRDEPKVMHHQVDPVRNIEPEEGQDPNGPIPRRGDPFAAQRDQKAAAAENKKEAKKDDGDKDKK